MVETAPPAPPVTPAPPPPPAAPEPPRQDPATLALLSQSDRALASGNVEEAIAYVERALRMNGQDVDLWLRLAELQLSNARAATAEQLAQRAIAMAGSRVDWQRRGWLIVADAKEAQGHWDEAERIRAQWRTYRG
jgi:tetratricopeptide (TPR) repeat protein